MRDLILHIGWPKTGSTTLQAHLAASAAELAGQGAAYYASRGDSIGEVSRLIDKAEPLEQAAQAFQSWLAANPAETIILSSEGLALNDRAGIECFIQPQMWRRITVVAYLRVQEDYLEGIYKQSVKWGGKLPLPLYLTGAMAESADYAAHLPGWEDWCAKWGARLILRIAEREALTGGDIRTDFLGAIGLPQPQTLAPSVNVSPSRALIDLYLRLPPIHRLQQINRRMVASGLPGVTGSGDCLDEAQRQMLRARYAAGNEAVRQRYFPERVQLFTPRSTEPKPQPEVEPIRDLLLKVIARRRTKEQAQAAKAALLKP